MLDTLRSGPIMAPVGAELRIATAPLVIQALAEGFVFERVT